MVDIIKTIAQALFTVDISKSNCNLIPEKMYSLFTQRPSSNENLQLIGTQAVATQSSRMVSIRFDTSHFEVRYEVLLLLAKEIFHRLRKFSVSFNQ